MYYPELLAGLVIIDPADFTEIRLNKRKSFLDIGMTSEQVDTLFNKWNLEDVANKNKPSTIPQSVFEGACSTQRNRF